MKLFKVRVINCSKRTYWYANKIGQEFYMQNCMVYDIIDGRLQRNGQYFTNEDIEIIGEFNVEVKYSIEESPIYKYKVLCKINGTYQVSGGYYESKEDFIRKSPSAEFVQLIEQSKTLDY